MMNRKMVFETIKLDLRVGIYNVHESDNLTIFDEIESRDSEIIFDEIASRDSEISLMAFTNRINEGSAEELHRNLDEQIEYINGQIKFVNDMT